jgi:hypothetical protein
MVQSGHTHVRLRASLDCHDATTSSASHWLRTKGVGRGPSSGHSPRQPLGMSFHFVGDQGFVRVT